jgi:23S rRNA pseudouridine1911/1915/1917 synthase
VNAESYTFIAQQAGERLDRTLAELLPHLSRAHIQRLIKEGRVTVDGETRLKPATRIAGGETIAIQIPPAVPQPLAAEQIPLDIVYQDDEVVVVNKPAGMVVHPAAGHPSGTLVNALLGRLPQLALVGGERRPGIVHRLDKDTSGLIVVALTEEARLALKAQFQERSVQKSYLALTDGLVSPPEGTVEAPIGRNRRDRKRMAVVQGGRPAETAYRTLETFDAHTLLEASPRTGRTHQIRVHLAFLGFPLAGDQLYGRRKRTIPLRRHFLHAHRLAFCLPGSGQEISLSAPLPAALDNVLDWLRRQ